MIRRFAFLFLLLPVTVHAQPEDDVAGRLVGSGAAGQIDLPLLKSDLSVDIQGDIATVQVQQVFGELDNGIYSLRGIQTH